MTLENIMPHGASKPTKITIRCEADSGRGVQVRAYAKGKEYFDRHVHPGEEAVLDKHEDIRVVVTD